MWEEGWLKDLDNWSGTENQREDGEGEESDYLSESFIDISLIAEAESEVLDDNPYSHDGERDDRQPRLHVPHDRLVQDATDHQDSMNDVIRSVVVEELLKGERRCHWDLHESEVLVGDVGCAVVDVVRQDFVIVVWTARRLLEWLEFELGHFDLFGGIEFRVASPRLAGLL